MDLDFSKLSVQDALDLAILVEEEAQERYEEFAKILAAHHSPEVAKFFIFMAGNEAKHGADLRARRATEFGAAPGCARGSSGVLVATGAGSCRN